MEQKVEAPFIGLVPIPSLLIDRIDIDFQMELTDTNTTKSTSSAETLLISPPNGLASVSKCREKFRHLARIPVVPARRRSIKCM